MSRQHKYQIAGVAVFAYLALTAGSSFAAAGITGSKHDFTSTSWATNSAGQKEICLPCHVPHKANQTAVGLPLWIHTASTNLTYTLYSSGTFNGSNATYNLTQPSGVSKACLSCHDGTTALDAYGGSAGSAGTIAAAYLVGGSHDLSKDHPISFDYTDALATADGDLKPPSSTVALGGFISTKMLFPNGSGAFVRMECGSCHDVHNGGGFPKLLLMSNANSALCLTCHDK